MAPPSKVGSGSPGTICCWQRGRAEAQLGWGRGGPRTGAPPPQSRRLRCVGGREAHEKTRLRTWFGFLFPLPLIVRDASGRRRGHNEESGSPFEPHLGWNGSRSQAPLHGRKQIKPFAPIPPQDPPTTKRRREQGRLGLGSQLFIKRSKGLKTRAPQDPREPPPPQC